MPWKGWIEQLVRGASFSANTSNMGFTAINRVSAPAEASEGSEEQVTKVNTLDGPKSVASAYLGRGQNEPPEQLTAPNKKCTTKSRKRAAPPGKASKAKKRRTSSVKDSLAVSKRPDQEVNRPKSGTNTTTSGHTSENVHRQDTRQRGDIANTESDKAAPTATKSISVYAPSTSMDALDSTSTQTSFNSVKANAGKSFTLYQGAPSSCFTPVNTSFTQSWASSPEKINPVTNKTDNTSDEASTARLTSNEAADRAEATNACQSPSYGEQMETAIDYDDNAVNAEESILGHAADEPIIVDDSDHEPRRSARLAKFANPDSRLHSQESFDFDEYSDIDEDDLVNFAKTVEEATEERPTTPSKRLRKDNIRDAEENEDYGGALLSQAEKDVIQQMKAKRDNAVKPIVRKPFLSTVLDRSPIFGASKGTVLRTCFRVGEALNTGSQAVRCGNNVVIELYARVTGSWREPKPSRKQHFVFKDLYHDKPPHLEGTYELWDQAQLWDLDSKPFLTAKDGHGMICRMIGKMRRDGSKWGIEVLSIWEASWEDVDYVAGIYTDRMVGDDDDEDDG